jgi:hypothetical protein
MASVLLPREHGAYAALGFPAATAFAIGGVSLASVLLFVCAVLAFVAHESALVALGVRGKRALAENGPTARRALVLLGGMAAIAGAIAAVTAPPLALRLVALPGALALVTAALVLTGREKTLLGELVALGGLVALALPISAAGGVAFEHAAFVALAWLAAFWSGTLAVRATVAKPRPRPWVPRALRIAAVAGGVVVISAAALLLGTGWHAPLATLALVPGALLAAMLGAWRVHPRHLRRLGWCMVAVDVAVLILLVVGLRSQG